MRQLDLFGQKDEKKPVKKKQEKTVAEISAAEKPNISAAETKKTVLHFEETVVPAKKLTEKKVASKKNISPATLRKRGRKAFRDMDAEADQVEVPEDEILFQKKYYAISEVAKWFNVNTSLLRLWENEFDVLKPRKNRKGDRLFRPEDVKTLQVIYYLLRHRKFSMEGAKQYLSDNEKNAGAQMQLIQSLTKFKSFLLELKTNLAT